MSLNDSTDLPDDPSFLARIVTNETLSTVQREQARQALEPLIRRTARRVAARAGQAGQDLIDESVSHVLHPRRITQWAEDRKPFESWCFYVLRHHLIDLVRQRNRQRENMTSTLKEPADPRGAHGVSAVEIELDLGTPFSPPDVARVRVWKAIDRIVLLCLAGLWRKVPAALWRKSAVECGLALPFPPPGFGRCQDREERNEMLARAMGWRRNTLAQRWCRRRHLLDDLDFVHEVRED